MRRWLFVALSVVCVVWLAAPFAASPPKLDAIDATIVAGDPDDASEEAPVDEARLPPRDDIPRLKARIADILETEGVAGAGIALVQEGRVTWAGGVGLADRAAKKPITGDTLFRVGSITKSFIALAVMQLVEEGKLKLDAPIATVAPELTIRNRWDKTNPITLAHVLEHTAGFDDMHPNELFGPVAIESMPLADVLAKNPHSRVARWQPGSRFSYANPGYTVAAYAIEKVTGHSYEDELTTRLLTPLSMPHAALRWSPEVEAALARGYDGGTDPVPYYALYHRPAGNLFASPRELASIVRLFLGKGTIDGRRLLSPESIARIERSETTPFPATDADYGLGNYGNLFSGFSRGHDGGMPGFLSQFGYLPDRHSGFVVLLNDTRSFYAMSAIRQVLVRYLLRGAPYQPPPPEKAVPAEELQRWAGVYHFASPRHQLFAFFQRTGPSTDVIFEDGRLTVRGLPSKHFPVHLVPLGGDRFRYPGISRAHVAFAKDAEGRRSLSFWGGTYIEEPRWVTLFYYWGARIVVLILLTTMAVPLLSRLVKNHPCPSIAWPVVMLMSMRATLRTFYGLSFYEMGHFNQDTWIIFVGTIGFAVGSFGTALQTLSWLGRPTPLWMKIHRSLLSVAGVAATVYLASYGIIGVRLWSY